MLCAAQQCNGARRGTAPQPHGDAPLDRETTIALFATAVVLMLLARWGDARRRSAPHGALALIPWHALMFVSLVAMLFLGVHLLAFFGVRN